MISLEITRPFVRIDPLVWAITLAVVLVGCAGREEPEAGALASREVIAEALAAAPVRFEEAHDEDGRPAFVASAARYAVKITPGEARMLLPRANRTEPGLASAELVLRTRNAKKTAPLFGENPLSTRTHYFFGDDPSAWRSDVVGFARVRAADILPGIDLVYYGNQGQIEYDFVVAPGAEPEQIQLFFDGASEIRLGEKGELYVSVGDTELVQEEPVAYQDIAGLRREVAVHYTLSSEGELGFRLGDYDPTQEIVIDPILRYSGYLAGELEDLVEDVEIDSKGQIFVVGRTWSSYFLYQKYLHWVSAEHDHTSYNEYGSASNAFVMKFAKVSGPVLQPIWVAHLGGDGSDIAHGVAVNDVGEIVVVGETVATNFPVTPGMPAHQGASYDTDAFITKFSKDGKNLVFSRRLGGAYQDDEALAVAVSPGVGRIYVTGSTESTNADLPQVGPTIWSGESPKTDAFYAKLDTAGTLLGFSYIGGNEADTGTAIAVDPTDTLVYIAGWSESTDLPATVGAPHPTLAGGRDGFAIILRPFALPGGFNHFLTYLGGGGDDEIEDLALVTPQPTVPPTQTETIVYLTGHTESSDFPVTTASAVSDPAYQDLLRGVSDAFVTRIRILNFPAAVLGARDYSTYLGGSGSDVGKSIGVHEGRMIVLGTTDSSDFPKPAIPFAPPLDCNDPAKKGPLALVCRTTVLDPPTTCTPPFPVEAQVYWLNSLRGPRLAVCPTTSAFVTGILPQGDTLLYSAFYGGGFATHSAAMAVDPAGDLLIAGGSYAKNLPKSGSTILPDQAGGKPTYGADGFLAKIEARDCDDNGVVDDLEVISDHFGDQGYWSENFRPDGCKVGLLSTTTVLGEDGTHTGSVVMADPRSGAELAIVNGQSLQPIGYLLVPAADIPPGDDLILQPGQAAFAPLAYGEPLGHALILTTSADAEDLQLQVILGFPPEVLELSGVPIEELQIGFYDPALAWVPFPDPLEELPPSFGVGEAGYVWNPDGTIGVWAAYDAAVLVGPLGPDADQDGRTDSADNCPVEPNPFQEDADGDGVGDFCDLVCDNGLDDDGDGRTDFAEDLGCDGATDPDERGGESPCDDGIDNDGDGLTDYDALGGGDPGCGSSTWSTENPACSDGLDNEAAPDGLIDFDGGASAGLLVEEQTDPDPQCLLPFGKREHQVACGLGFEIVFVLVPLLGWRRRCLEVRLPKTGLG